MPPIIGRCFFRGEDYTNLLRYTEFKMTSLKMCIVVIRRSKTNQGLEIFIRLKMCIVVIRRPFYRIGGQLWLMLTAGAIKFMQRFDCEFYVPSPSSLQLPFANLTIVNFLRESGCK